MLFGSDFQIRLLPCNIPSTAIVLINYCNKPKWAGFCFITRVFVRTFCVCVFVWCHPIYSVFWTPVYVDRAVRLHTVECGPISWCAHGRSNFVIHSFCCFFKFLLRCLPSFYREKVSAAPISRGLSSPVLLLRKYRKYPLRTHPPRTDI